MYGTLTGWRAYALARGVDVEANDTLATQALVRASDYIKFRYVQKFCAGYDDSLPVVEEATYEAAILEGATPGFFTKTFSADQQKVLTEVKGIKWTPVGDASGADGATPVSTKIDAMLAVYTCDRGVGLGLRSVGK